MNRNDIEIMAPAGSYESLMAAIQGGADSVYFGVEELNMRAASSINFSLDELRNIADICNDNNKKSYLTINVVVFDQEIEQMHRIVDAAIKSGISGIIASDLSVINYAFRSGIEVHLFNFIVKNDHIDSEITFNIVLTTDAGNVPEIIKCKID